MYKNPGNKFSFYCHCYCCPMCVRNRSIDHSLANSAIVTIQRNDIFFSFFSFLFIDWNVVAAVSVVVVLFRDKKTHGKNKQQTHNSQWEKDVHSHVQAADTLDHDQSIDPIDCLNDQLVDRSKAIGMPLLSTSRLFQQEKIVSIDTWNRSGRVKEKPHQITTYRTEHTPIAIRPFPIHFVHNSMLAQPNVHRKENRKQN